MPSNSEEYCLEFRQALMVNDYQSVIWYLDNRQSALTEVNGFLEDIISALELIRSVDGEISRSYYENVLLEPSIVNNNLALLEYLCASPATEIETTVRQGISALELAVLLDNPNAVSMLLKKDYDLAADSALIIHKSRLIVLQNGNLNCLRQVNAAYLYQLISSGDFSSIQSLLKENNVDLSFKDAHGNTPLHHSILTANRNTLHAILFNFSHALNIKNNVGETPVELINRLIRDQDIGYLFEPNHTELLSYLSSTVLNIDRAIIGRIDPESNLQRLSHLLPVFRQLTDVHAEQAKARLITDCSSKELVTILLESANIKIEYIKEGFIKKRLQQQQELFIKALTNGDSKGIDTYIQQGVNPNFYLDSGETPLTMAVKKNQSDCVSSLMKSLSIDPHMANKQMDVPAFLAFFSGDVRCFSIIMMDPKTPSCETRSFEINFPLKGWTAINLDDDSQADMWEGLSRSNYMEESYNAEGATDYKDRANLKDSIGRLFNQFKHKFSVAKELSFAGFDESPFRPHDAYFLTKHRQTAFLDDPGKRGQRECQSAVLSLSGYPVGVFSHEIANKQGASVAYFVNPSRCLTATKGDMDSQRLWTNPGADPSGKEFHNPSRAINNLDKQVYRPGNSIIRSRSSGVFKQRTHGDLVQKIKQMSARALAPFYPSTKSALKHGPKATRRIKFNDSRLFYLKHHTLPYNEVLIKTAAMDSVSDAVSDVSHVFLTENKGDLSLLSLLVSVSTQMELMLHNDSKRYFPIVYYNATKGEHVKISVTALSFLTKLAEICQEMPIDCLRFDFGLKQIIQPLSIEEFLLGEHTSEKVRHWLLAMCVPRYHHSPALLSILDQGQTYSHSCKGSIYLPYVSELFNKDLYRATTMYNEGKTKLEGNIIEVYSRRKTDGDRGMKFFTPMHHATIVTLAGDMTIKKQLGTCTPYKCSTVSKLGHVVMKHMPSVEAWNKYWLVDKEQIIPTGYLFDLLSVSIINQPYEDEPQDFVETSLGTLYRPNHDVSHAIRKYVLVYNILKILEQFGRDEIKQTLKLVTKEERSLLMLTAFLERSGRTNEDEGRVDTSNVIRSMEIIREIALQLGFNQQLIQSMWAKQHLFCKFRFIPSCH